MAASRADGYRPTAHVCTAASHRLSCCRRPNAGFAGDGYVVVPVDDLPSGFHDDLYKQAADIQSSEGQVWRELAGIYEMIGCSARVRGALTSILGPDFMQHPHRALHQGAATLCPDGSITLSDRPDQQFHKDGNHVAVRDHLPRWVMCMYYPVETTVIWDQLQSYVGRNTTR